MTTGGLEPLYDYCASMLSPVDPLLLEIERTTHLKTLSPRMLSGAVQGSFLTLLSHLTKPKFVLEIGTFTGYAAICLAKGLAPGGKLITIEYDKIHAEIAQTFIDKSGLDIELIVGDAKEIIPQLTHPFDLVFIDADKSSNALYYDMVIDQCNLGGLIMVDNVLWNGKVVDKVLDRKAQDIHDFNLKISTDPRVENVILPIRDGLHVIRKIR